MGSRSASGTRLAVDCNLERELQSESEPSAEELNQIVLQIGRLVTMAGLDAALRVGALIVHHFYDGDTNAWRVRGHKTASFRRIAEHPGLPMSPGALYRCVAVFELCDRLHAPSRWRNLGASHLRAVLGLDAATQERLLSTANSERWTVRTLQAKVLNGRVPRLERGGRRPQSPGTKIANRIRKCLEEHREAVDQFEEHDIEELCNAVDVLDEARQWLAAICEGLRNRPTTETCALTTSEAS
jgi:hypothetical protein